MTGIDNISISVILSNIVDLKNSDEQFRNKYTIETKIIIAYLRQHRNLSQIQERIISEIESQLSYQRTYSKVVKHFLK